MAIISPTHLTAGGSDTDTNVFTTASVSPVEGGVLLLSVGGNRGGGAAASASPTIAGNGLTWTAIDSVADSTQRRLTVYRALATAPTAGTITITWADTQTDGCCWSLEQVQNLNVSGVNGAGAIVQSATNNVDASSMTVTLGAFSSVQNATFGAMFHDSTAAITPGSGFSELAEVNSPSSLQVQWRVDNDTSVDWSWTGTVNAQGVAMELRERKGGLAIAGVG